MNTIRPDSPLGAERRAAPKPAPIPTGDRPTYPSGEGLTDLSVPSVARGFRLQWEEAQGNHVLLYPEGMVKLNRSAGEILTRCDGVASLAQIVSQLETAFSASGLRPEVEAFLQMAREQRWVTWA